MAYMKRYYEEMTEAELEQFMLDIEEMDRAYARVAEQDDANYDLWLEEQDSNFSVMIDDGEDYYEHVKYW